MNNDCYKIDGVEYPRVTKILDMADKGYGFLKWAKTQSINYMIENILTTNMNLTYEELDNIGKDALYADIRAANKAATYGTDIHGIIEIHINNKLLGIDKILNVENPEYRDAYNKFRVWEKTKHRKIHSVRTDSI